MQDVSGKVAVLEEGVRVGHQGARHPRDGHNGSLADGESPDGREDIDHSVGRGRGTDAHGHDRRKGQSELVLVVHEGDHRGIRLDLGAYVLHGLRTGSYAAVAQAAVKDDEAELQRLGNEDDRDMAYGEA